MLVIVWISLGVRVVFCAVLSDSRPFEERERESDVRKEVCSLIGPQTTSSSFAVAKAWSHHGFIHLCVLPISIARNLGGIW